MISRETLIRHVQTALAEQVDLPIERIFASDATLSTLILASDRLTNSVDLMEAFARTANRLRREYGIRVRLPAFALDTTVSAVMDALLREAMTAAGEKIEPADQQ